LGNWQQWKPSTSWQSRRLVNTLESIVDTIREPPVVLDAGLRAILANRSFYETFKID
jgi:hypothetical protein